MRKLIESYPEVRLTVRGSAFETLLRAIIGQQISVKAAQSVWKRFEESVSELSPEGVSELSLDSLKGCGVSGQKASYILDLARHFISGAVDPQSFSKLDDDSLMKVLCSVRGIGRWTAEMFMIFYLHRPNIWPVQDIGLIRALERYYIGASLAGMSRDRIESEGERFQPWRTVATWYLWRSLDPFPVEY
jgi:DNA-3-methyladenine glycosylase II